MKLKSSKATPLHRIVIVGNEDVGKSTLIQQFTRTKSATDPKCTQKDSYQTKVSLEGIKDCSVDIVNMQEDEYEAIRNNHYRKADGFIIVFDLADYGTFPAVGKFREQILKAFEGKPSCPILLVGNKSDLKSNIAVDEQLPQEQATLWNIPYIKTSAKGNVNVEEAFRKLLLDICQQKKVTSKQMKKLSKKKLKLKSCIVV